MRKKLFSFVLLTSAYIFAISGVAAAQGVYPSGSTGVDVSYPNCSARISRTAFGVVGVTGGLAYSYNSCLTTESANFSNLSFYMNTGWYAQSPHVTATTPRQCAAGDNNCLAYNYGYNAALDALNYAKSKNIYSSIWWLDVETSNTWSSDVNQNRNSLQGSYEALTAAGAATIGAYSTTAQWQSITGGWLNNWPSWGATTWTTSKQASKYCSGHQFTGGPTYLIQYKGKIDQDYAC